MKTSRETRDVAINKSDTWSIKNCWLYFLCKMFEPESTCLLNCKEGGQVQVALCDGLATERGGCHQPANIKIEMPCVESGCRRENYTVLQIFSYNTMGCPPGVRQYGTICAEHESCGPGG